MNMFPFPILRNFLLLRRARLLSIATLLATGATTMTASMAESPVTESQAEYDARAQWLRDAKLGIFIHWNPSSVAGREISWSRADPIDGMPVMGVEAYDSLYKKFAGEKFNAKEWVKIMADAGARYVVVVPKHHDGFSMYNTKVPSCVDYTVMKTPFGRDYVKEMSAACAGSPVQFCLYYSILDWWNKTYSGAAGADLTKYKEEVFKPQMKELLSNYGKVGCIWFDGHWDKSWTHKNGVEMYNYIRKLQPATLLGNRIDQRAPGPGPLTNWTGTYFDGAPDPVGDYAAREGDIGQFSKEKAWDSCIALDKLNRWAWVPPGLPRDLSELVEWMVQCIGRDGAMLVGIGPQADGTILPAQAERLKELGDWIKPNASAIYKTRGGPWLPDSYGVSTHRGNRIFLFLKEFSGDTISLTSLPVGIKGARLLTGEAVAVTVDRGEVSLKLPSKRNPFYTVVEVIVDGDAAALAPQAASPPSLALGKTVEVSSKWAGRSETDLKPAHITDGNPLTAWAAEESATSATVTVDLGKEYQINRVMLAEGVYHRVQEFNVEALVAGKWQKVTDGKTFAADSKFSAVFPKIPAQKLRLNILKSSGTPLVSEFQIFGREK